MFFFVIEFFVLVMKSLKKSFFFFFKLGLKVKESFMVIDDLKKIVRLKGKG